MIGNVISVLEFIFTHEYFLALYGVVAYYSIIFNIDRRNYGKENKNKILSFNEWKRLTMANFLSTALVAPLVIIFDDEIMGVINGFIENDINTPEVIYIASGPITAFVTRLLIKNNLISSQIESSEDDGDKKNKESGEETRK